MLEARIKQLERLVPFMRKEAAKKEAAKNEATEKEDDDEEEPTVRMQRRQRPRQPYQISQNQALV
jgi:hypothetical protein